MTMKPTLEVKGTSLLLSTAVSTAAPVVVVGGVELELEPPLVAVLAGDVFRHAHTPRRFVSNGVVLGSVVVVTG
jgi:hypothetical protein